MYGSLGLGFLGLTQCLVPGETGAAQVAGTRGNPRGQLVVCRQNGAHLVTACARPPGGKLGLVRVSRVSSVPGPGGGGGKGGRPSEWPGPGGNPRGQLVRCRQSGVHLVAAHARSPGGAR